MCVLAVNSLTKRFGATVAVENLSFEVQPGRVAGFLGPNGAGKTTTLRALLGLIAPSSGTATVDGRPYRDLEDPARSVGAVLEGARFHPGRCGRDHLRIVAAAARLPDARVDAVLRLAGLADIGRRRVSQYSLGMRQRLALAGAMLGDPRALVLDEPANGLDPDGVRWLREFLRARAQEARTVLVSSHVLAEMAQTVDEVIVVSRGRLIAHAPLGELTQRARGGVRLRSPHATKLVQTLEEHGIAVQPQGHDVVAAARATLDEVGRVLAVSDVVIHEMTSTAPSLEEVFLQLTEADRPGP